MVKWTTRGFAFLIDYAVFQLCWGAVDNAIVTPGYEVAISFAEVAFFTLYFVLTEGLGATRASLGKRMLGLAVRTRDGHTPSTRVIFERAAIVSLLLVADIERWVSFIGTQLPYVAYYLPMCMVMGLGAYNLWLGFRGKDRLMLQDGLTGSEVVVASYDWVREPGGTPASTVPREWPGAVLCVWVVAAFVAGGLAFLNLAGQRLTDTSNLLTLGFRLESVLAEEVELRTRVSVTSNVEFLDGTRNQNLGVSIWIPFRDWSQETISGASIPGIPVVAFADRADDLESVVITPKSSLGIGFIAWEETAEWSLNFRSPEVQLMLGAAYYAGRGVPQNDEVALKWLRRAAEQGNVHAQVILAAMYKDGRGVARDEEEAARLLCLAADKGYDSAQNLLGVCYARGLGVETNMSEAARWFRAAAEQGHARAQYNLAGMYEKGRGIPQDPGEAVRWYRSAAEQGVAAAQYSLGYAYLRGLGVEPDLAQAGQWWHAAAEQGDDDAQYAYGYLCSRGDAGSAGFDEAVFWYEKAAAKGDAWARYALGSHLWLGAGIDRDAPEAAKWFGLAAGDDDYSALVQRFTSAAAAGEDDAEFFLGMMYLQGHGVPQDEAKAVECFEKASERGYLLGQVAIATLDNS